MRQQAQAGVGSRESGVDVDSLVLVLVLVPFLVFFSVVFCVSCFLVASRGACTRPTALRPGCLGFRLGFCMGTCTLDLGSFEVFGRSPTTHRRPYNRSRTSSTPDHSTHLPSHVCHIPNRLSVRDPGASIGRVPSLSSLCREIVPHPARIQRVRRKLKTINIRKSVLALRRFLSMASVFLCM